MQYTPALDLSSYLERNHAINRCFPQLLRQQITLDIPLITRPRPGRAQFVCLRLVAIGLYHFIDQQDVLSFILCYFCGTAGGSVVR